MSCTKDQERQKSYYNKHTTYSYFNLLGVPGLYEKETHSSDKKRP